MKPFVFFLVLQRVKRAPKSATTDVGYSVYSVFIKMKNINFKHRAYKKSFFSAEYGSTTVNALCLKEPVFSGLWVIRVFLFVCLFVCLLFVCLLARSFVCLFTGLLTKTTDLPSLCLPCKKVFVLFVSTVASRACVFGVSPCAGHVLCIVLSRECLQKPQLHVATAFLTPVHHSHSALFPHRLGDLYLSWNHRARAS